MRQLFDKTKQKVKKKAGKAMGLLRPPSHQGRSTLPAPLRQVEDPTSLAVETESQSSDPTVPAAVAQATRVSISDLSQRIESAATEPAPPPADEASPTVPAFAEAPPAPTILATTGSALKVFLRAARDGSDLFLPLKAALVGVVALWDIFDRTTEAAAEFAKLESKLSAINAIAAVRRDQVDSHLQARLTTVVGVIQGLWEAVEQKRARGGVARVAQSAIDLNDIKALNNAISSLLELFQFEGGIAIQHEIGLLVRRFEASDIERKERERVKEQKSNDERKERERVRKEEVMRTIKSLLGENFVSEAADDEQPSYAGCMAGTRDIVLSKFTAWVKNDPMAILWLAGMAGTGKTSIAVSLCRMLRRDTAVFFGGGFFCSRSAGSIARTDVRRILPTLAARLAGMSAEFADALAEELKNDQRLGHKPVDEQIDPLLSRPLAFLASLPRPIVFVIDALDECRDERELADLLRLVADFKCEAKVKFILTSRPEQHIRNTPISNYAHSTFLHLHTIDVEQVTSDIRLYITRTLEDAQVAAVEGAWYTDQDVDLLVNLAGGLFIFASTVLKYVLHRQGDAVRRDRLRKATSAVTTRIAATTAVDRVYEFILVDATRPDTIDDDEMERMRNILACILTARTSLSIEALAALLDMAPDMLRGPLEQLHSLVYVPQEDSQPGLQTLHASFGDYLFERGPAHLRITATLGHDLLTHGCLSRMMWDDLCFNVSRSNSSFKPNPKGAPHGLAPSLIYACLHWAHHIDSASNRSAFDLEITRTVRPKFLFWLEVLSVLDKVGLASELLRIACAAAHESTLLQFFHDADAFVSSSYGAISRSAPHIYLSALAFVAKQSLVYCDFSPLCTGLISVSSDDIGRYGSRLVATLTGHEELVRSVCYSPDGCLLASGSDDTTVRIWDTRTGSETTSPLQSGDGLVICVAFSPNGQHVAAATYHGVITVWRVSTGRTALHPLRGHTQTVFSVAYSPDGTLIASASGDQTVRLWSAITGLVVSILIGHMDWVYAVAFSPDGRLLASASRDKTIRLWNPQTGEAFEDPLRDLEDAISCLGFSSDGAWLAGGSLNDTGMVRVWDVATHQATAVFIKVPSGIRSLAFSPDGSMLALPVYPTIQCRDPRSGQELTRTSFSGHSEVIWSVAFSPNGQFLASASEDRTIRIWDAIDSVESPVQQTQGHSGRLTSVAVSPDGTSIVSGSFDRAVGVWDVKTGHPKYPPLLGHGDAVMSVSISLDNRLIASSSADHTVRLWDMQSGEPVGEPISAHKGHVRAVAFSPDASLLATGSLDSTVRVWEVETRKMATFGLLHCVDEVTTVAFSPDGRLLAAADFDGRVYFWRSGTDQQARTPLQANDKGIHGMVFSPESTRIVTGGFDNAIRVWDIADGFPLLVISEHFDVVCSVGYSPDGLYIASGSDDKTVRLWDAQTGDAVLTLYGHGDMVESVTFTPDGRSIVSGSSDATIRVWDVEAALTLTSQVNHDPLVRLGSATLTHDGWLVGSSGELLLWLPPKYRGHISLPPCSIIIGSYPVQLEVDEEIGGLHWGDEWEHCWRGAAHSAVQPSP